MAPIGTVVCEPSPAPVLKEWLKEPELGSEEHRKMVFAITPKVGEVGLSAMMESLNTPQQLHWVKWWLSTPDGKKRKTYEVVISINRPDSLKQSFADAKVRLQAQGEKVRKEQTDPKLVEAMDPNYTEYSGVGEQCYSTWTHWRRYYMRRGPFLVEVRGEHSELPFVLLQAYDNKIQAYLETPTSR